MTAEELQAIEVILSAALQLSLIAREAIMAVLASHYGQETLDQVKLRVEANLAQELQNAGLPPQVG